MGTAELHHQKQMRLLSEGGITMRETIKSITKRLPSIYIDVPALRPGTAGAYALAFAAAGVAAALRVAVDPYLVGAQFVTFFPAIVITTLISGFGAGFFCAVLSTAAADFFVLEPRWSFNIEDPANVADLLLFGPLAAYCAILIGRMRLAIERQQAERAMLASKDNLQVALDEAHLLSCPHSLSGTAQCTVPGMGPGVPTGSICARAVADKASRTLSKTRKSLSKSVGRM
jgi:Domain of unknown function (DUF4118)